MSKGRKLEYRCALSYLLLLAGTAGANPSELFGEGNRALAEKRFEAAINLYMQAAEAAPEAAEIQYNLGHAQYRSGAFIDAAGSYELAASLAETDAMRSRCRYNMGNCMVRVAEGLRETDPHAAAGYCRQAAGFYRAALEYSNDFPDAAYNLEISLRIAASIERQIREQEEKKPTQEADPDESSENEDDSDMDCEVSVEEAEMYEEADPFGDFSEYEEIRGVPPPNQTEMDILAEEIQNQARRKKKKAGAYKAVEKDW